ncbi:MAG: hypothetical protein ACR2KG_00805 [Nocardioidaceae bacterium]
MRRQQQDLQLKVRERYRRLLTSDMDAYDAQVRLIVRLFRSEPAIRNLLDAAARTEPELDTQ